MAPKLTSSLKGLESGTHSNILNSVSPPLLENKLVKQTIK